MAISQQKLGWAGAQTWAPWLALQAAWNRHLARKARLDVRALPDHLKRDMGFLDGNDPSGRHR